MSRVNPDMGGRGRQRDAQRNRFSSGRAGQTPTERAAGPNVARWRRLSSQPSLPAVCVWIDAQPFRLLLCRRCVFPSPCPVALADVVVSSTSLAIVELRAQRLACLGDGATRWSAPPHREAGAGRVSTNVIGLRFRCDLIQCEGRTPSGSLGGRIVPLWRRIICDRHDSGLSPEKGWHSQKRCSVAR